MNKLRFAATAVAGRRVVSSGRTQTVTIRSSAARDGGQAVQTNFPWHVSVEDAYEKLSYNFYYLNIRNIPLDLLVLTARVIPFREGAR